MKYERKLIINPHPDTQKHMSVHRMMHMQNTHTSRHKHAQAHTCTSTHFHPQEHRHQRSIRRYKDISILEKIINSYSFLNNHCVVLCTFSFNVLTNHLAGNLCNLYVFVIIIEQNRNKESWLTPIFVFPCIFVEIAVALG